MFRVGRIVAPLVRRFATTTTPTVSTTTIPYPASSIEDIPCSLEVTQLADRLCSLDLIRTAQLVSILKKRLNLPDVVAAPVAVAGTSTSSAATVAPAAPVVEKTEFRVTLEKFDPANKAKTIKEIKAMLPQLNLVEAKTFVESAPKLIKEKIKKEEADKIKATLEALGATITLD